VTVPVARASARRTVRVAAGLVAGQAVLCAVIGYVTLGNPVSHTTNGARIIQPLGAGPIALTPPAVRPPSPPTVPPAATTRSTPARAPAATGSRHRTEVTPAPTPTPAAEPPPDLLVGTSDPSSGASSNPTVAPTSTAAPEVPSTASSTDQAPSPPVTQLSVTIGDTCAPIDAVGVATDGSAVRCAVDADNVLRWHTVN
jgi:hypothetical protein